MVIGVMLSGILSGLVAMVSALMSGFPMWLALLLYPLGGLVGVGVLLLMVVKSETTEAEYSDPVDSPSNLRRAA